MTQLEKLLTSSHTLQEQLRELEGARTLASAVYFDDRATAVQKAAARQLLLDIRRKRQLVRAEARRELTTALQGARA